MGFVFKSAFWLGLVYYAMPLGGAPTLNAAPSAAALFCSSASAPRSEHLKPIQANYHMAAAAGCAAALAAMTANALAPKSPPPVDSVVVPPRPSAHSLVGADRQTPWFGHPRSAASGEGGKQS